MSRYKAGDVVAFRRSPGIYGIVLDEEPDKNCRYVVRLVDPPSPVHIHTNEADLERVILSFAGPVVV